MSPADSDRPIATDALLKLLAEQIKAGQADLVDRYQQALRATLFTNRADVRPTMLRGIAMDEAAAFRSYLLHGQPLGTERGADLCQMGLGEQAVLGLCKVTSRFILTHLESDLIVPALDAVYAYQSGMIQGFVDRHEKIMLVEQERIRGALQVAVSHYTVEIKEVQDLAQRAVAASEFKSRFMARVSHELRTPLGALMGMSEMLQADVYGPLTPAQQDIVQRIINNAHALERFFAEILDQSLIESGQLRLKEESFSPQVLVETVHSTCLPLALRKGLSLQVKVDPHLPSTVMGDRGRTEEILSNLVVNAIKFTDSGGVGVNVSRDGDAHWAMQVKDSGIGISEENLAHIFEPFHQVDETTARRFGGVGLGLAIVQQLVTAMNGTVSVKSKIGQGSTFTVVLPLRTPR